MLALRRRAVRAACEPVLVGERAVWRRAGWRPGLAALLETGMGAGATPYGRPTAQSGRLSFSSLRLALRLAARGAAAGLVTAPISKKAWALAGVPFGDHTEYLRAQIRPPNIQMALGLPSRGVWSVLATRHVPLAQVSRLLTRDRIIDAARALRDALRLLGRPRPRLGLCAFNPHAGEDRLLGPEEAAVLAPAARRARAGGLRLEGPVPADTAWRWNFSGRFDGLVSLYHDQALIPLKAVGGLGIVNWSVGLPFPRTSPGHGTGFDLAGRGEPDATATAEAALLAAQLAVRGD